jgi:hypothetical protein
MLIMRIFLLVLVLSLTFGMGSHGQSGKLPYENNFEKAQVGKVPDDLLVLEGDFTVKEEGGNKFLELPGAPVDNFGVLFGPTEAADVSSSGRIFASAKGRRFPAFGIGLNGVGGYKLQISAAKKQIELFKGDDVVASKDFEWAGNNWTVLRIQVRKQGDGVQVEGKAWKEGGAEPKEWQIVFTDKTPAPAGRASLWGNPFSGTPIRFDDLRMAATGEKK